MELRGPVHQRISIHALVQRATATSPPTRRWPLPYFNPRPRAEGDKYREAQKQVRYSISIHALVQRATMPYSAPQTASDISIHALVQRATKYRLTMLVKELFQSTPSCRGRQALPE